MWFGAGSTPAVGGTSFSWDDFDIPAKKHCCVLLPLRKTLRPRLATDSREAAPVPAEQALLLDKGTTDPTRAPQQVHVGMVHELARVWVVLLAELSPPPWKFLCSKARCSRSCAGCIRHRHHTWGGSVWGLHLPWMKVSVGTLLVAVCAQFVLQAVAGIL